MGSLSTKKKTYVGMSMSRLTEDDDIVDPSKLAIMDAITNGGSIVDNLVYYNSNSYYRSVRRARKHAEKINYFYGLPEVGNYVNADDAKITKFVEDYLKTKPSLPEFQINKVLSALINYDMYAKEYLHTYYDFNSGFEINKGVLGGCSVWLKDAVFSINTTFNEYIDDDVLVKTGSPYNWGVTPYRANALDVPATPDVLKTTGDSYVDLQLVARIPKITTTQRFYLQPDDYIPEPEEPIEPVDPPPPPEPVTPPEEPKPDLTTSSYEDWITRPFISNFDSISLISPEPVLVVIGDEITEESYPNPDEIEGGTLIRRSQVKTEYFDYDVIDRVDLSGFYEAAIRDNTVLDLATTTDADYNPDAIGNPNFIIQLDASKYISLHGHYKEGEIIRQYIRCIPASEIPGLLEYTNALDNYAYGSYIPNIYLRTNGYKMNSPGAKDQDYFKTSKKVANKLGLNYSSFIDDMHEVVPSLGEVSSIILLWGVSLSDTFGDKQNPLLAAYAYEFYNNFVLAGLTGEQNFALRDKQMNGAFGYKALVVSSTPTDQPDGYFGSMSQIFNTEIDNFFHTIYSGRTLRTVITTIKRTVVVNTYTISKIVDGVCHSIEVQAPFHRQNIMGNVTTSTDVVEDSAVFIPYDLNVVDQLPLSLKQRNKLTAACAQILFLTSKVVKTKWYKRGVFKVVMIVIAVVLAVVFPPAGGWTLAAALSYAATAIAVTVAINVVITLLIKMGFAPSIVAILAAVAAIVISIMNPLAATAGTQITARVLLMAINTGFNAFAQATAHNLALMSSSIAKEMANMQVKLEELEESRDALGLNSIDYLKEIMFKNLTDFQAGETPDQFLLRTTTVNVADISLKAIYEYTGLRLSIPKGIGSPSVYQEELAKKLATLQLDI